MIKSDILVYVSPFSHIDAFAIGAYFSLYGTEIKVSKLKILGILIAIVAVGVFTSKLETNSYHFNAIGYFPYMGDTKKYVWGYTAFALFFSYLLIGLKRRVFFPKLFEHKLLSYLGKISYGLYIFHLPIIYLCERYLSSSRVIVVTSSLLLTIFISALSFELFEKKVNKLKDRFFYYKQL